MCLVIALFQMNETCPLIVAANREESRDRPTRAPFRWSEEPTLWAGRDEVAGGKLTFDYILRPGPSPTTNALKIMQIEGLPVDGQ